MKRWGALFCLVSVAAAVVACSGPGGNYTTVTYVEDTTIYPNPERGWWKSISPPGGGFPGNSTTPHPPISPVDFEGLRDQGITLVRDCILIPEVYRQGPIAQEYLDEIERNFAAIREAGLKVVPRFHYIWGMADDDAPEAIMLLHIEQLRPLLERNADVIYFLQLGMFGGCGEGIGSTNGHVSHYRLYPSGQRVAMAMLEALTPDRMMGMRHPRYKRDLLGIGLTAWVTEEEAFTGTPKARIGNYSDCYLYNSEDANNYELTREFEDMQYLMNDSQYVVQSGEPSASTLYAMAADVVAESARFHWSAMTVDQTDVPDLYAKWQETGEFENLSRRWGYRFRLVEATLPRRLMPGAVFSMTLVMANDGFARLVNPRRVEIVLRNRETGAEFVAAIDGDGRGNRLWLPGPGEQKRLQVSIGAPADLAHGEYGVFLALPDPYPSLYERPEYAIRLANQGVWEPTTGYNSLLHTVKVRAGRGAEPYTGQSTFGPKR